MLKKIYGFSRLHLIPAKCRARHLFSSFNNSELSYIWIQINHTTHSFVRALKLYVRNYYIYINRMSSFIFSIIMNKMS